MALLGTLLFHLNLNYSSIEVEDRRAVVQRCYRPMLGLLERLPWLVMAVEAPGHTLELLEELDPGWLEMLAEHVRSGRVELVGSGDTQLIGPLVPRSVNAWNQRLGQETYERVLGTRPTTALVNELAWSQGIVDAYLDAGYELVLMEWNNPRRSHPEWDNEWRYGLVRTAAPSGREIALAWIDAIAFQKFQRVAHGELELGEYRAWLTSQASERPRHLFLYANDAEVFDHRPGRYRAEPPLGERGEWRRIVELLEAAREVGIAFTTPARVARTVAFAPGPSVTLTSAADPIPVKKQPKYQVTRWALSGRDDVGLNARCFAEAERLESNGGTPERWRAVCRLWSSDLRTHITEKRWRALAPALSARGPLERERAPDPTLSRAEVERSERALAIRTDGVELELLPRRGLAIRALRFPGVSDRSLVGTLPHGTFDHIDWAADFYSGNTSILRPAEALVTDLEPCEPAIERFDGRIEVRAGVPTALGVIGKRCAVYADRVELGYGLSALGTRPKCSLRTGTITLLPDAFGPRLALRCANGGLAESFTLEECDHGRSVSPLVSASAAVGATDGTLVLSDGRIELELAWPMAEAAALPLLTARTIDGRRFLRCVFSLAELDETFRAGARLHDFRLTIRARRLA